MTEPKNSYAPSAKKSYKVTGTHRVHRLVTSSEEEAIEFAELLRRDGFEVIVEEIVDLEPVPQLLLPLPSK